MKIGYAGVDRVVLFKEKTKAYYKEIKNKRLRKKFKLDVYRLVKPQKGFPLYILFDDTYGVGNTILGNSFFKYSNSLRISSLSSLKALPDIIPIKYKCIHPGCNNIAEWVYMPGFADRVFYHQDYVCDEHVSRGCSCEQISTGFCNSLSELLEAIDYNVQDYLTLEQYYSSSINSNNIEKTYYKITKEEAKEIVTKYCIEDSFVKRFNLIPLDEKLREYVCCEYSYSKEGYLPFFDNTIKSRYIKK